MTSLWGSFDPPYDRLQRIYICYAPAAISNFTGRSPSVLSTSSFLTSIPSSQNRNTVWKSAYEPIIDISIVSATGRVLDVCLEPAPVEQQFPLGLKEEMTLFPIVGQPIARLETIESPGSKSIATQYFPFSF
jgi:hypothetical protein